MKYTHLILHLQRTQRINYFTREDRILSEVKDIDPHKVIILVIDMWNQHWCKDATERVKILAEKMNKILIHVRELGIHIIHCPSETMDSYQDRPERKMMQNVPNYPAPINIENWSHAKIKDIFFPIRVVNGGCFCIPLCHDHRAWTSQISTIQIEKTDGISDSGHEIFNYIKHNAIEQIIIMGVHTNMCILGRPFGIRRWVSLGIPVALCRDLTDSMYSPKGKPYVSHEKGTELIIEHIERKWCPTLLSSDFYSDS